MFPNNTLRGPHWDANAIIFLWWTVFPQILQCNSYRICGIVWMIELSRLWKWRLITEQGWLICSRLNLYFSYTSMQLYNSCFVLTIVVTFFYTVKCAFQTCCGRLLSCWGFQQKNSQCMARGRGMCIRLASLCRRLHFGMNPMPHSSQHLNLKVRQLLSHSLLWTRMCKSGCLCFHFKEPLWGSETLIITFFVIITIVITMLNVIIIFHYFIIFNHYFYYYCYFVNQRLISCWVMNLQQGHG